jgi:hypothetical protein
MNTLVQNSTFSANRDDGFQLLTSGVATGTMNLTFNGNHVHAGGNAGAVSAHSAINFDSAGTATVKVSMTGGDVDGADGSAIIINPVGTSHFDATITSVTVGTATALSGSASGHGIWAKPTQNVVAKIVIQNSLIRNTAQNGMQLRHNDASVGGTSDFTITGNTITSAGNEAIFVQSASLNTDIVTVCADIGGTTPALENSFAGAGGGGLTDIAFSKRSAAAGSHLKLPGFTGNGASLPDITAYIQGRNAGSPSVANFSGALEAGPAACAQPSAPTLP